MVQDATDEIALDHLMCFSIYATNLAFSRVYRPLLDRLGLTYPQYLVLVALWQEGEATVGDLGRRLSLASSTVTPVIKRLQAMGYLGRHRDDADERLVRVRITEAGEALRRDAAHLPGCILAASGLDAGDCADLVRLLAELRSRLLASADSDDV